MKKVMTSFKILVVALIAVTAVPSWAADAAAQKQAEAEVTRAVHEMVAAYATTDVDKYFSYYADDMSLCCRGTEQWSTKKDYYEAWKANIARGGGVTKSAVVDLRVQVSLSADMAITSYQMPVTRKMAREGQAPEITYNMLLVWVKRNGRWIVDNLVFSAARPNTLGPNAALAAVPR